MKSTRFAEMLLAVCGSNRARFTELVNSPYFNKNHRVKLLWDMLDRVITGDHTWKSGTGEQLHVSDIQILEAIEPDAEKRKKITPANLRMVLSDFVKLAEDFLVLESGAVKETAEEALIEICRQKNLHKSYRKYIRLAKQRCLNEKDKDTAYYNRMYSLECEVLMNARTPEEQQAALGRISTHTDHIWMCMKLDNFIKFSAVGGDCRQLEFYDEIMRYIERNGTQFKKQHPLIYSRHLVLRMLNGKLKAEALEKYTSTSLDIVHKAEIYSILLAWYTMQGDSRKKSNLLKIMKKANLIEFSTHPKVE